jgi:hypothetical protein
MTLAMHFLPAKAASVSDSFESWSPVRGSAERRRVCLAACAGARVQR